MTKKQETFNARKHMEMALDVMKKSIQEPRNDKISPRVGVLIIKPDGEVETAFRGELRHGDHAEFTLLERKNRSNPLDGSVLFSTLEPCAPGARKHPKLSCAERIVNARIKKVWVGIEDPDPAVDRKGIKYLIDNGVEVELFDADLQDKIRKANKQFIKEAEDRAKKMVSTELLEPVLSEIERAESNAHLDDLSKTNLISFINKAGLDVQIGTNEFNRVFSQLGLLELEKNIYVPTGIGLLLFGNRPQLAYPNALIRATYKTAGRGEDIETIQGPLVNQADKIQSWYESRIGKQINRSQVNRKIVYDYPLKVFREAIINAIVHRDYDIKGAPIYFEINDDSIIIKSPGSPVEPLNFEQIKRFNAPSLSRNPKIMYVFDQLELVEQRGLGFQTIKDLPKKYGLPLPIVSFEDPYIVFTFPMTGDAVKKLITNKGVGELSNDEMKGYNWIRTQNEVSTKHYADYMHVVQRTASRHLAKMLSLGLIVTNGGSIKSPNLRYLSAY